MHVKTKKLFLCNAGCPNTLIHVANNTDGLTFVT